MNRRLTGWVSLALSVVFMATGMVLFASGPTGVSITSAGALEQREPFTDTACLDCHTDQARLEELTANDEADEPEEASLSSGPG